MKKASQPYQRIISRGQKFRFGIFSDVQYADCDDGYDFTKTRRRFYRHGIVHMKSAFETWKAYSDEPDVDAVINLGDSLDGRCHRSGTVQTAIQALQCHFDRVQVPIHNVVGNHDLYNINRKDLLQSFLFRDAVDCLSSEASSQNLVFYDFSPLEGFRVVILDAFDISSIGLHEDDERFLAADALLRSKNSNNDLNDHTGLKEQHFVRYNGGLGPHQQQWLQRVLTRSAQTSEAVIIISHVPLDSCCSSPYMLLWNYAQVSELVQSFSRVVKLVLCGHTHEYKMGCDAAGIVHLTMPALLETSQEDVGTALLELSQNCIKITSNGNIIADTEITC